MSTFDDSSNRRKYPRYNAPICYRTASFFSSRKPLVNIGLGGMRIYSDEEFKIGKRLEIELLLPNNEMLRFTAKVAWQNALPKEDVANFDIGLQFLDIAENDRQHLSHILQQYQEE